MPNANYRAGTRLERLWMEQMRQQGYQVMRSAGSKGKIDCIAWNDTEMILVQVKNGKGAWRNAEVKALKAIPRPPGAKVFLVVRNGTVQEWDYFEC